LGFRWFVIFDTNINQEENSNKNLNSEHNEALLQGKTLLEWRAALGHIRTDSVVIDIR
jgi:hypothetical protein